MICLTDKFGCACFASVIQVHRNPNSVAPMSNTSQVHSLTSSEVYRIKCGAEVAAVIVCGKYAVAGLEDGRLVRYDLAHPPQAAEDIKEFTSLGGADMQRFLLKF